MAAYAGWGLEPFSMKELDLIIRLALGGAARTTVIDVRQNMKALGMLSYSEQQVGRRGRSVTLTARSDLLGSLREIIEPSQMSGALEDILVPRRDATPSQ